MRNKVDALSKKLQTNETASTEQTEEEVKGLRSKLEQMWQHLQRAKASSGNGKRKDKS